MDHPVCKHQHICAEINAITAKNKYVENCPTKSKRPPSSFLEMLTEPLM